MSYQGGNNNPTITASPKQSKYGRLGEMSISELESKVFDNGNSAKVDGAMDEVDRIKKDYSRVGSDYSGSLGRVKELLDKYGLTKPEYRLRGVVRRAESRHKQLERIIETNQQRACQMTKEMQAQKDRETYAEVLMRRYEVMMEQNRGKIEHLKLELEAAKVAAAQDPENLSYQEIEAQVHELEYDNQEIVRKYRGAANVVIKTDARTKSLEGRKALADKGARKAENTFLASDLLIEKLRDYANSENVSPKEVVAAIADAENINSQLRVLVGDLDSITGRAFGVYDRLPEFQEETDESDEIREQIRKGNAVDQDLIIDRAKKIIEQRRAAA